MTTKAKPATTDKPLIKAVPVANLVELIKIRTIRVKHLDQMQTIEDPERRDLSVIGDAGAWIVLRDEDTGRLCRVHVTDWQAHLIKDAPRTRPAYDVAIREARDAIAQYPQLFQE